MRVESIKEILLYDPKSGALTWRVDCGRWGRIKAGSPAGHKHGARARIVLEIEGKKVFAHRVAYALMTGKWPDSLIDHRDGDGTNNRWENIRPATARENSENKRLQSNNTSGMTGVSFNKNRKKFVAYVDRTHLGSFSTADAANAARLASLPEAHPFQPTPRTT